VKTNYFLLCDEKKLVSFKRSYMAASVNTICKMIKIASLRFMLYASKHTPPMIYKISCLLRSLVIIPTEIRSRPMAPIILNILTKHYNKRSIVKRVPENILTEYFSSGKKVQKSLAGETGFEPSIIYYHRI